MSDISKIKAKLAALMARTVENGASEAEAMVAMAKAEKIMAEHGVSIEDVRDAKESDFRGDAASTGKARRCPISYAVTYMISKYCGTKSYWHGPQWVVFGFDADVEMAMFLREVIVRGVLAEWKVYKSMHVGKAQRLRASFIRGACRRINDRLASMIDKRGSASGGTDLALSKEHAVTREFERLNPGLRLNAVHVKRKFVHRDAYEAGAAAGDRVSLSRPIEGDDAGGPIMIGR